jgi:nitroreductase
MPDETANLFEIMATTRSMRRLKPDPVPADLIRKVLEAGVSAPSGGNMQRWRFLVIRDAKIKETVGAYYKRAWDEQVAPRYRSGEPAPGMSRERFLRLLDAAEYLVAHIHEAPIRIVPCLEGGIPRLSKHRNNHTDQGRKRHHGVGSVRIFPLEAQRIPVIRHNGPVVGRLICREGPDEADGEVSQ